MAQRKLEAIAVQLPDSRKINHRLGVRMGSTDGYVNLYVDGRYTGDLQLDTNRETGELIIRLFLPTGEPRYFDHDLHPGKYEWNNRHEDFEFHDFDWE